MQILDTAQLAEEEISSVLESRQLPVIIQCALRIIMFYRKKNGETKSID